MKAIKMLGLAALAALMAMAFVGASSAMASDPTALCDLDPGTEALGEVCPEEHIVKHVHEETLKGAPGTLLNSISNVLCTVLFLGDVIGELLTEAGTPLEILGKFTYENCTDEKPNPCTVEEVSEHALILVLKEGHELALVTGHAEVKVVCSGISCTYKGEELKGHGLGPLLSSEENGDVTITEQTTKKVKGLLCPSTAKLDITVTPLPDPVYITE